MFIAFMVLEVFKFILLFLFVWCRMEFGCCLITHSARPDFSWRTLFNVLVCVLLNILPLTVSCGRFAFQISEQKQSPKHISYDSCIVFAFWNNQDKAESELMSCVCMNFYSFHLYTEMLQISHWRVSRIFAVIQPSQTIIITSPT
jgi:hypothetical protein